jgi:hypothetical protein
MISYIVLNIDMLSHRASHAACPAMVAGEARGHLTSKYKSEKK